MYKRAGRSDRLDGPARRLYDRAGSLAHGLTVTGTCLVFGAIVGYALGEGGKPFPVPIGVGEMVATVVLGCVGRGWMLPWTAARMQSGIVSRPDEVQDV